MSATLLWLLLLAPAADPTMTPETRARAFVAAMQDGKFTAAAADFDDTVRKALPADKLEAMWKAVVGQVGALEKQLGTRTEKAEPFTITYVGCKFAKATLDVKVVFDKQHKIAGLNFLPTDSKELFPAPAYAKPDSYRELAVKVGTGEWQLPGTLAMPKGGGPFPAVVLVHGSGAQDRDETIGRLKPFRDLAWGLASNGIAVLRYEKRTREHALKLAGAKSFTVKEETVDDALLAAEMLRKTPGIDPKRIYVVGHSLGAMMAPRIALADPALAGIVLLAAPSRQLEELLLEQTKNGLAHRDRLAEPEIKLLETLQGIGKLVKEGRLTPETPAAQLLGQSAVYWQSVCGFSVVPEAKKLTRPMLILQGENDNQVTMTDFRGWQEALEGRKNVTLKSYPKLGHMFTPSAGTGDPKEMTKPGNVAKEVIGDLAAWVLERR